MHTQAHDEETIASPELDELRSVRLDDPAEALAWSLLIGCTPAALRAAVREVGDDPDRVRQYLLGH
jgi:hypothetical protein